MAEPFLGEIRLFPFPFAPTGWALCDGSLLPINQNQALYALLGTRYGGNGTTTFALPDLRGRVPIHTADRNHIGEKLGEESHQLTLPEIPAHYHQAKGSTDMADSKVAAGQFWAASTSKPYAASGNNIDSVQALATMGSSQTHTNMQPYTVVNFCIAITGFFPPRS